MADPTPAEIEAGAEALTGAWTSLGDSTRRHRHADSTIGSWETEKESCEALDLALDNAALWRVYKEVAGVLLQPRPAQAPARPRIDRILIPTSRLLDLGWNHGAVGVEVKKSGVKIGPAIAQSMDYLRTAWRIPTNSITILLDWIFIWPMPRQLGTVASILSQQRVGSAYADTRSALHLKSGEQNVIKVSRDGTIEIGAGANGCKVGSR